MTKLSAVFCKKHIAHIAVGQKKLFGLKKIIFGALGRHFFEAWVTFQKLRIFSKNEDFGCKSPIILVNYSSLSHSVIEGRSGTVFIKKYIKELFILYIL